MTIAGIDNNRWVNQLLRYGLVGLATNFVGYCVYLLITHLGATPKITMSVLYGVGVSISFFGNRSLTFADSGNLLTSGTRFIIAHSCGYLINLAMLIVLVDKLGYPHQWVQVIAIFVVAAFLFIVIRVFVFKNQHSARAK